MPSYYYVEKSDIKLNTITPPMQSIDECQSYSSSFEDNESMEEPARREDRATKSISNLLSSSCG